MTSTSSELPSPLTPPDCDLRDFPFMPLDVVRLRDSDLAATESAEAFRSAVLLWCASCFIMRSRGHRPATARSGGHDNVAQLGGHAMWHCLGVAFRRRGEPGVLDAIGPWRV